MNVSVHLSHTQHFLIPTQHVTVVRQATRPGDKLLLGKTCSLCSSETGGLGAVATDLLEMIDVLQSRGMHVRKYLVSPI